MAIRTLDVPMHDARPRSAGWGRAFWLFVKKNPLGAAGGLLMLLLIVAAVLAEVLATHNPIRTSNRVLVAPGAEFSAGHGQSRPGSLEPGGVRLPHLAPGGRRLHDPGRGGGGLVGLVSGYVGGKTDLIAQRARWTSCRPCPSWSWPW